MTPSNVTEETNMTSGMDPGKMSDEERIAETAALLSTAMLRLWFRRRD